MIQDLELPTSASSTHILGLNFDCLHAIFSLKCFSMLDLCSIGEAHCRLKEVVDDVFAKQHKNYEMYLWGPGDLETATRILSNFGPFISELSIGDELNKKLPTLFLQLLDVVIEHCSSIESIKFSESTISKAASIKLQQIFDKLQIISLSDCLIYSGKTLFANCESLVELTLDGVTCHDQNLFLENTFPKLHRFKIRDKSFTTNYFRDSNIFYDFFSRHQNLKSLTLGGVFAISHCLPGIADNCKQLAELEITFHKYEDKVGVEKALTSILTLDHLNKLKICRGRNFSKFINKLKNLKSLEILTLWNVDGGSEFVSSLSKITSLEELELRHCYGLTNLNPLADLERLSKLKIESAQDIDFDLVGMIKRLINLKTLEPRVVSFKMNKKMYLRIVNAIRERPRRFQNALEIWCYTADDGNSYSYGDVDCRKLLRILET